MSAQTDRFSAQNPVNFLFLFLSMSSVIRTDLLKVIWAYPFCANIDYKNGIVIFFIN